MPSRRPQGGIDRLLSGALRVRVYAGIDPVTKKRHYLVETVPPGPKAEQTAEAIRHRFIRDIEERRHPRTSATLNQLLDKHLEMMDVEESTRRTYVGYVDKHIRPLIGHQRIGAVDASTLESFYRELRRCRDHCQRGRSADAEHSCKPLAPWTIRKIHFILSGAYKRAVRWKWVGHNPVDEAEPPSAPQPDPQPPTADEAARLLTEAWKDADFGPLVWTAMTTGARRGELCALRWRDLDADRRVLVVQRSVGQDGAETWEKDTKTHQRRNVALDATTTEILIAYREHCEARAAEFGELVGSESYLFAPSPDGRTGWKPASVTQRYDRMATRLGIDTTFHKLRHYSATELIASGVDIRTVAGRLGHSGGGTTTLKVYAAWLSEADQRASAALLNRMPERPSPPPSPDTRAMTDPRAPYERIAAELRVAILDRSLAAEQPLHRSSNSPANTRSPWEQSIARSHS